MFVSTVNPGVEAQQYYQPMKASDYDHVLHTMPLSRGVVNYPTCDQDSNISISVLNNNTNTPRQTVKNNQIPAMTSLATDSLKPEVEILPLSYSDCQLSSAVYSSLHQGDININDKINFTRVVPNSYGNDRTSCQMKTPEMASSSCRLLGQSNIPSSKPSPLGQLRLPTIKVTDNVAANVMSEEQDVGYFSFSDISSLHELTDISDVMNCSDESDELFCDSNFSDIIEDVLDSLDQNSKSEPTTQNSLECSEKSLADVQTYSYPTTHQTFSPDPEQYHTMPVPPSQQYFDHPLKWYTPGQFLAMSASSAFSKQTVESRCELCNKCFQTKASLRVHMRQHRGERPHQCAQCKKTFTQKSTLRTHIRTHTGERPYNCDFCSRAFGDYSTYRKHVRVHTGEKPYACDICKKTFTQSGNMIRHRMVHFKKHGLNKK